MVYHAAMSPVPEFKTLTRKDVRAAAGRAIICGFEGTSVTAELKEILREVQPLGLILFARNIESPEQVAELARELKLMRKDEPLLLSVDQEGGRVQRIKQPATVWPPMRHLGQLDDERLAERVGRAIARELRAMSFDVDFAPVLDVDTNPKNPIIGDRAFSNDPKVAAKLGAAFVRGMQSVGVGACGKHFPGHGDTDLDSHLALPRVEHELPRLREVEWPPFAAAIAAGVGSIMTAHVITADLDERVPATLSREVLGHLRDELRFKGVIVSDDLEMRAVADHYAIADMAEQGLVAGVDVFLACKRYEVTMELFRGIVTAVEDGRVSERIILDSQKRALRWRERFYAPPGRFETERHVIGCAEHADLVAEIESRMTAGA